MQWCGLKFYNPLVLCSTLQSPLMKWCGLKFDGQIRLALHWVTTDAVVWIEIDRTRPRWYPYPSPLMQWCGLKYVIALYRRTPRRSPLMQWCGLKLISIFTRLLIIVTTDAVVWIEMPYRSHHWTDRWVTTDAVVWIEICYKKGRARRSTKSPLMQWCGLKYQN